MGEAHAAAAASDLIAVAVLGSYGAVFLLMTLLLRIPEASTALARVVRR